MTAFRQDDLDRLARRVLAGEVVFFVGAGFSLDSEKNSAKRLIARLLARFEALTSHLRQAVLLPNHLADAVRETASELHEGLRTTFGVKPQRGSGLLTTEINVGNLAREYYHINDWMCSAFSSLLEGIRELEDHGALSLAIWKRENEILKGFDKEMPSNLAMELSLLFKLKDPQRRGKALFLDTMGFADLRVMAGAPLAPTLGEVAASYRDRPQDRLRDRHHVLARLAREGLSPILLTTNYDRLLEGAYRLAGFTHWERTGQVPEEGELGILPPSTYRFFSPITDATQFFGFGDDHHTALVVKIHGCATTYRQRRNQPDARLWESYLPSMVFTFREIQDWREDSWSRDFLRTLLRTRTLVFCGYSGVDPVLHNTFRTVYEEMATRRKRQVPEENEVLAETAPAFFLGLADKKEFHGLEILRAASQAVGSENPELTDHPNYLQFYPEKDDRFPRLDELMRWMFHLTMRRRQEQTLETDLRRIYTLILRQPPPTEEVEWVREHFAQLVQREQELAKGWTESPVSRPQLERLVGWTEHFHAGLMREFALAEAMLRNQRPGVDFQEVQKWCWHYPSLDHPDWTAWATVVEIGLRRLLAVYRDKPDDWTGAPLQAHACSCLHPTVAFSVREHTPVCLTIRLTSLGWNRPVPDDLHGAFQRRRIWELRPEAIPWSREEHEQAPGMWTPGANLLWEWAFRPDLTAVEDWRFQRWIGYLGESHD